MRYTCTPRTLSPPIVKYATIGSVQCSWKDVTKHLSLSINRCETKCSDASAGPFFTEREGNHLRRSEVAPDPLHASGLHTFTIVRLHTHTETCMRVVVCRWIQGDTTMKEIVGFLDLISCRPASHLVPNKKPDPDVAIRSSGTLLISLPLPSL